MAKTNVPRPSIHTHEGAIAQHINSELQLRRSVMACLIWENEFYEDGQSIAKRIADTIPLVKPEVVSQIAIDAREKMKLRHIPLFIVREMARHTSHKPFVSKTLTTVIQRADELAEFLAIYWKDKRQPLSAQVKKGLASAFCKFNEYALAKYNRDGAIKLRDVLFLCHAKPKDKEQEALWKRLINNELVTPDTWEVALSAGKNKKETWERLIRENSLGGLAFLRNLRNMKEANVDEKTIFSGLEAMKTDRILPYRFISAAKYAPQWEDKIEPTMLRCLEGRKKLPGKTVLLVDVSGSMDQPISAKSDMTRMDAACGLAIMTRELCENVEVFAFSDNFVQVPPRRGFALRDAIVNSQRHSGTPLGLAVKCVYAPRDFKHVEPLYGGMYRNEGNYNGQALAPDRLIVITDEQSSGPVPDPKGSGYMINVASATNGVGYGAWMHIDGWSEAILDYIREISNQ